MEQELEDWVRTRQRSIAAQIHQQLMSVWAMVQGLERDTMGRRLVQATRTQALNTTMAGMQV